MAELMEVRPASGVRLDETNSDLLIVVNAHLQDTGGDIAGEMAKKLFGNRRQLEIPTTTLSSARRFLANAYWLGRVPEDPTALNLFDTDVDECQLLERFKHDPQDESFVQDVVAEARTINWSVAIEGSSYKPTIAEFGRECRAAVVYTLANEITLEAEQARANVMRMTVMEWATFNQGKGYIRENYAAARKEAFLTVYKRVVDSTRASAMPFSEIGQWQNVHASFTQFETYTQLCERAELVRETPNREYVLGRALAAKVSS